MLRFWLGFLIILLGTGVFAQNEIQQLRLLLLDERNEETISLTDSLIVADSLLDEVLFYKGKAYQSLYRFDSAFHYYSLAFKLDTGSVAYRVSMGQMLSRLGRNKEAISIYEELRSLSKAGNQQLTELASLYSLSKKYAKSLDIYRELLNLDSLNYYYLKQAGKCYQNLDQADSALVCFESAFKINPKDVFLTHQIANIYLKKKDLENAIFSIQKGFVYDTANLDLLKLRGYIWMLAGEYQMAVWDLEKARDQDSNSVFIQKYLGLSYFENKQFAAARESLLHAYQLDSLDAETAFFIGSACRWSRHEDEGVIWYKKSIEIYHPDPQDLKTVYLQMAELLKVLHRFDETIQSYHAALDQDPSDNVIYFKLGQLYDRNLNQKERAIRYYELYLKEGSTDQQLFNAEEGSSTALEKHVRERIGTLKEELFFETPEK